MNPLIVSLIAFALLASSAQAQEGPLRLRFAEDYGPMTPRYTREVEGLDPENLEAIREKLLSLRNLKDAEVKHEGDTVTIRLTEAPYVVIVPKVVPFFWPVGVEAIAEDWRLGGHYYDFKGWAGYVWSGVTLYEPGEGAAVKQGSLTYNFLEAYARAGVMVLPYTRIYLEGKVAGNDMTGNTALAASYGRIGGAMVTLSPFIRFDNTDHPDMPRRGTRIRAGVLLGPRVLGNSQDYLRYDGTFQAYWPLGKHDCLALSLHGGWGEGNLPLPVAYWLGGGNYLRGYASSRFIGNQMLSTSFELRHALLPNLWDTGLTVWSAAFLDAGRAWPALGPLSFPEDIRPAVGGYLGLSLGNWYIGRLEAAVGNEGPFVSINAGLPFPW